MVRFTIGVGALLFFSLDPADADQVLACKSRKADLPMVMLLIKGDANKPTQIVWPGWGQSTVRTFVIKDYSDIHYAAIEQGPKSEDPSGSVYINRLDGELLLENYISRRSRQVVVKLCDGEITRDACQKQQEASQGGNIFACFSPSETECARWRNGSNLLSMFYYTCAPSEPKF
jgi:hypothetical protein